MPATKVSELRNQLKKLTVDVEERVEKSLDANKHPDAALFATNNADIEIPMGQWVAKKYKKAESLQEQIDEAQGTQESLDRFKNLSLRGQERAKRVPLPDDESSENKDLTKTLMESDEFKEMLEDNKKSMALDTEMSLKELFGSNDTNATDRVNIESVRDGDYIPLPRTRVTLLDLIPQIPTTERVVKYDREVKNLSSVGVIVEGGAYAESEFQINEATADVVKIGCYLQVSEELLDDAPEMRARIDGNLDGQMLRRIQSAIVGGAALPAAEYVSGANTDIAAMVGFLDLGAGLINTIDSNAGLTTGLVGNAHSVLESAVELVYSNGQADADAIVMHSKDWVDYVTLQATTGSFIARGALEGTSTPVRMQINGLPVILCNALPEHTVLVGAFRDYAVIRDKQDVRIRIQEAFAVPVGAIDTVVQTQPTGRFNIFTDARMTFYARRGLAFCTVTDYGVPAT